MFSQVQPAPTPTSPGLHVGSSQVSQQQVDPTASTSRSSRLRGLSYLRNYTQTHLLSREHAITGHAHHHHQSTAPSSPTTTHPLTQTSSLTSPSATTTPTTGTRPTSHLFRSTSDSPAGATTLSPDSSSTPTANYSASSSSRTNPNRLTLVNPDSHPLGLAPPPRPSAGRRSTDSALPPVVVPLHNPTVDPGTSTSTTTTAEAEAEAAVSAEESDVNMVRTRSATASETMAHNGGGSNLDISPSIRFSTFYDPRAARPSLTFSPISRTLPTGSEVIRVGRYSERDSQPHVPPNVPSAAPVGFKSKVVSRRHCEFWYEGGKWYIKDVKSSSGTFLNHIRLSPPGTESKPFPINDGDIVQLGIDFKGGEEMIFRCVKMRLELNRGWQNKLNTFNMTTHKRLRNLTASSGNASATQSYSQDCSICLNSIAPCQCLFVAPCSHTWHYKCVRSLLSSPSYPIFICPNCRAAADLEADVEDPEEWEQADSEEESNGQEGASLKPGGTSGGATSGPGGVQSPAVAATPRKSSASARSVRSVRSVRMAQALPSTPAVPPAQQHDADAMDMTMDGTADTPTAAVIADVQASSANNNNRSGNTPNGWARNVHNTTNNLAPSDQLSLNATTSPMPIPAARAASGARPSAAAATGRNATRTPSPTAGDSHPAVLLSGHEGPITPRNDAGPWVFDGSGVRMRLGESMAAAAGGPHVTSLDAAANGEEMEL